MSDDFESIRAREKDFLARHLPEGARSGHAVLFDFDGKLDYTPTAEELAGMLTAYLALIDEAAKHGPEMVRACLGASELALGTLGRAKEGGIPLPKDPLRARLVARIRAVLTEAAGIQERPTRWDGYKRIDVLANVLEESAKADRHSPTP